MKKIVITLIGSMILGSSVFALDLSSKSNKELELLAGKLEPKDMPSYFVEVEKRVDGMTLKEARDFRANIRANEMEIYDNMKTKDFKAREQAIKEEMMKFCKANNDKCPKFSKHMCNKNKHDKDHKKPKFKQEMK